MLHDGSWALLFAVAIALALVPPALAQRATEPIWPAAQWAAAEPAEVGLDRHRLEQARDFALAGGGSGYIIRHGRLVMQWGDPNHRYDIKSSTKSFGAAALGLAIADGLMKLDDRAVDHHPSPGIPPRENQDSGWIQRITLRDLATHTAGFAKPGGYHPLMFEPGTTWAYSDAGPNWLAECLTLRYERDLHEVMFDRVFAPIGIVPDQLTWRNNSYREQTINGIPRRELGSGIHASVDAMARLGYLFLRQGHWGDRQILPASFIEQVRQPVPGVAGLPVHEPQKYGPTASSRYGLLWWNNADGTLAGVPRDAYWSWGLHESFIIVIPSLDMVIVRAGGGWRRNDQDPATPLLEAFMQPVVAAAQTAVKPPYPPSPVIAAIEWAPAESIVRRAPGSDNWPITWGDDGHLYTAYGDGWGFEPLMPRKLSLGLARVEGEPPDFTGVNIPAPTAEDTGDDVRGRKSSGMLMVDGVLYLWTRNVGNSQLGYSADRGQTWQWAGWKFTESFGHPTFLNFGRNYAGARDGYVYVYSHDCDNAYDSADRFVLARVAKDRLLDRDAYEFFVKLDEQGEAIWTGDIRQRGSVFDNPGICHRSGITYNAGIGRYLWWHAHRDSPHQQGNRFAGGFAIYDAPQPWGPWTTVYHTANWDVGPGESGSFPTKWMSDDGRTVHLVFSGDDYFSVRRARLILRERP